MITNWHKKIYSLWINFKVLIYRFGPKYLKQKFSVLIFYTKTESNIFLAKIKNLKKTNFELGLFHFDKGALNDAIFRFKIVNFFWPELVKCNYYIGRGYVELLKLNKAKAYIEKYLNSQDKEFEKEALFCENIINDKLNKIKEIPVSLTIKYFDSIAPIYNSLYDKLLSESVQGQLVNLVNSALTEQGKPFGNSYLDIGCGTGLIGKYVRSSKSARNIEGLDFSKNMINEVLKESFEGFPLYNKISLIDFESFISESIEKYDVIIAAYFLNYYTNIENLISFCKKSLLDKGILALAFKSIQTVNNIEFNAKLEEFKYNLDFIRNCFEVDFLLLKEIEINTSVHDKSHCLIFIKK